MGSWKRLLFWEFPRASWQYDVVVLLIIAFVFATPRDFFKDQPRPVSVSLVQDAGGRPAYWIEPDLLSSVAEADRLARANALIKSKGSGRHTVVRIEPVVDAEQELKGYMAFTTP
jgi:hypothetical protein